MHVPVRIVPVLLIGLVAGSPAFAEPATDLPSTRHEVAAALEKVEREYGRDAVKLQSHLLSYALQGGSELEASIAMNGKDTHEGKTFMVVNLDTGIVYDESEIAAPQYPAKIWTDIVDPTLRQFETIEVPDDGIALHISYRHADYDGRTDLYRRMRDDPPPPQIVSFHLLASDVVDMVHARITSSELLRRSQATLDGHPVLIEISGEPTPLPTSRVQLLPH